MIGARARDVAGAVASPLVAALVMGALVLLADRALPPLGPVPRLTVLVALGGASYAAALLALARPLVDELIALVRR